jgi:rod shape-determining protein MreC
VISFRRYRDIALVVFLLAVPFFFLRVSIRRPAELNAVDRAIMRFSAPLQYGASRAARTISGLFGDYVYLVDVKADNNKLAYENSRLLTKVRELSGLEAENRRLKRLLGLRESLVEETASAVVVGKDTMEYFRVAELTLDNPGVVVRENMPVISMDGVVGVVLRTAGEKISVQLTVDSGFGVDVVVERTKARGFVRGTGDQRRYAVRVEYVQRTDEVDVGDFLVTSGVGCRFPGGLPVARVTKVTKGDFGIYQEVEAVPTVDFSRLEETLIVLNDPKDCVPTGRRRQRTSGK